MQASLQVPAPSSTGTNAAWNPAPGAWREGVWRAGVVLGPCLEAKAAWVTFASDRSRLREVGRPNPPVCSPEEEPIGLRREREGGESRRAAGAGGSARQSGRALEPGGSRWPERGWDCCTRSPGRQAGRSPADCARGPAQGARTAAHRTPRSSGSPAQSPEEAIARSLARSLASPRCWEPDRGRE